MEIAIGFQATPKASFCRTTNPYNPIRTSNSSPSLHFQREILGRSISSSSTAKPHCARSGHIHHQAIRCSLSQAIQTVDGKAIQTAAGKAKQTAAGKAIVAGLKLDDLGLCHGTWMTDPSEVPVLHKYEELGVSRSLEKMMMMLMLSKPETDDGVIIPLLDDIEKSGLSVEVVLVVPSMVDTGTEATPLLKSLGDSKFAKEWVKKYMTNHSKIVTSVCLGALSELSIDQNDSNQLTFDDFKNALDNVKKLTTANVSTMVDVSMLLNYSPTTEPAICEFDEKYKDLMKNTIIPFLKDSSTHIFHRIIPYFEINNSIPLINYLIDSSAESYMSGYVYVYDAMFDSIYHAMKEVGSDDKVPVRVVSGWPTKGSNTVAASLKHQKEYINNLNRHVKEGTPAKPKETIMNYVDCLVDQDQDPRSAVEWKNFGIVSID